MLSGEGISLTLNRTSILSGIDVRFDAPEAVSVIGRSGAGKTSLLHCLAGLRAPTSGTVVYQGKDLYSLSERERAALRLRQFGFVFQRSDLLSELTLRDNIALPLEMRGESLGKARVAADQLIEVLGITDCAGRKPERVSGGQRQRAAIGRALVGRPRVVFADEPTGALDADNGDMVMELLLACSREMGSLLVMVTHDRELASRGDRLVEMADGRVIADHPTPREAEVSR